MAQDSRRITYRQSNSEYNVSSNREYQLTDRHYISKELALYAWDSEDVKIILSMTGIDVFSAMLIS